MYIAIAIAVVFALAYWSERCKARENGAKLVCALSMFDAAGMGREAVDVVRREWRDYL